ncbi:hypothetical protein NDU88_002816 [Pleurodeles waltl]|uniref:Uncharacterized protein n=1 Tax=Pleurodeles waltl TaxID=8319 RepID=A0AAV7VBM5_PLEWA|nr:hypothetical protein NDU88_002816 [Pleurodeles waltl]
MRRRKKIEHRLRDPNRILSTVLLLSKTCAPTKHKEPHTPLPIATHLVQGRKVQLKRLVAPATARTLALGVDRRAFDIPSAPGTPHAVEPSRSHARGTQSSQGIGLGRASIGTSELGLLTRPDAPDAEMHTCSPEPGPAKAPAHSRKGRGCRGARERLSAVNAGELHYSVGGHRNGTKDALPGMCELVSAQGGPISRITRLVANLLCGITTPHVVRLPH